MIKRLKNRASLLIHSKNFAEFTDNLTPYTIQFIAAIPLFIYLIQPLVYLREGFHGKIVLYTAYSYEVNLAAIVPIILILWGITILFLIIKMIRCKISLRRIISNNPVYILFLCFIAWMIISVSVNGFNEFTLFGEGYRNEGILTYTSYICILFFTASLIYDERIKRVLCETSLISSIGTAAYAYYRYYFLQSESYHLEDYPTAFFSQFNHYGYYLAINIMLASVMLVMAKTIKQRVWYIIALSVNIWMLNLNQTFGAWLACVAGIVFIIIARVAIAGHFDWHIILPTAIFFVITIIMSILGHGQLSSLIQFSSEIQKVSTDSKGAGTTGARWILWKSTIHKIKQRPIFGYGVEGIGDYLVKVADNNRCHCEYLNYAVDFGIPAAVSYTLACIGVIVRNIRNRKNLQTFALASLSAAFAYLVSAVVGNSMFNSAPFFFIFLGLGYRSKK